MNPISNWRTRRSVGAGVLALFLGAGVASAQAQPQQQDRTLDERQVRELVERALPSWDERVLEAKDGADWSARLSPELILRAVGDKPLAAKGQAGARRIVDGDRVLRLYGERGKLRYVHRGRAWKVEQGERKNVERKVAEDAVRGAVGRLGLPADELATTKVAAQIAQGASTKRPTERQRFEMYQVVSLARRVNGLPVYGSKARAAVTHAGEVQRLQVDWPAFRMPRGLAVRAKEAVIADAVKQIYVQQPRGDAQVKAYLAYAPADLLRARRSIEPVAGVEKAAPAEARGDDETSHRHRQPPKFASAAVRKEPVRFVPVLVISVLSLPTPYQVIVPVAAPR